VGLQLQAHALRGFCLILIRDKIISDARSPFATFLIFLPTTLFIAGSMCRSEHSDHQNVPSVVTLG